MKAFESQLAKMLLDQPNGRAALRNILVQPGGQAATAQHQRLTVTLQSGRRIVLEPKTDSAKLK